MCYVRASRSNGTFAEKVDGGCGTREGPHRIWLPKDSAVILQWAEGIMKVESCLSYVQASRSNGTYLCQLNLANKKVWRENMMEDVERASGPTACGSLPCGDVAMGRGNEGGKSLDRASEYVGKPSRSNGTFAD